MTTFWSTDDEKFMKDFSEKREIVVFMVSAKDEKHKVRVEIKKPLHITLDDLDYTVIYDEDDVLEKEMREIIDTKLKEKSTKDYNPDNTYYGYESPYQQNDYNKSWEKRGTEEIDVGRDNNGLKGFKEFDEMSDDEINAMLGEEKY